ncbi:hypothetical protein BDB00DRAFT_816886 [Zychaea mexicana]|uniref:uncharacterized protein n=1 Tax=Zychaea mexicana TaxID=64656 RepID=UPI0022FDEDCC|nr:uncharacterized protein BDB00DRAFT_816886 [Zychaea mexicana]KAI9494742.1 hypothetical protein BDB00DRAFT_816886 [Zychaea mexicana]
MALKLELEQWQHACEAFDNRDYDSALRAFYNMADNAKMHFNIGLILASLEDHERAIAAYSTAISMDPFFAVAYFQMGVSHFVLNHMEAARQDFDNALQKLRGNPIINYQQLGLAFRLYSCEVLFNRGICQLYLGKIDAGLTDLYHAQKSKMTEEHEVIDQAVRDRGKGYSVYSIPPGVLYRPPENRLRQLRGVDMFAAADKLQRLQQQHKQPFAGGGLGRNNSVLLRRQPQQQQHPQPPLPQPLPRSIPPSPLPSSSTSTTSSSFYSRRPTNPSVPVLPQQPQLQQSRSSDHPRRRKDSNVTDDWGDSQSSLSSYSSRYRSDGRRIDSGFESTHEQDRYSSSSSTGRNSTRSHKTSRYSPPPVPPIPRSQSNYDEFDSPTTTSITTAGTSQFDLELDEVYGSLHNLSMHAAGNGSNASLDRPFTPQPSTSTSSAKDLPNKIKIKVHYSDTRILLMPTHVTFDELLHKVRHKFNAPPSLRLQYKDEDDEMVIMIDDDDLSMARQICRMRNGSSPERMEIWCIA